MIQPHCPNPYPEGQHLGGAIPQGDGNTLMPDVWGYLMVKFNVRTMFDVGCGYGHTVKWFLDQGVNAYGIDGWKEAVETARTEVVKDAGRIIEHDFTRARYVHGPAWDLTWSAEFVEHVDEKYIGHYMPLFQAARYSVITHAEPMQNGHNHVCCHPSHWWAAKFAEYGLEEVPAETDILRRTDRRGACWGRRTLMFFRQK